MAPSGITLQVREGGLSDIESDIPTGLTLAEYAATRPRKPAGGLVARMASIFLPRRPR
jgi:hypothetical protein